MPTLWFLSPPSLLSLPLPCPSRADLAEEIDVSNSESQRSHGVGAAGPVKFSRTRLEVEANKGQFHVLQGWQVSLVFTWLNWRDLQAFTCSAFLPRTQPLLSG